MFAELVALGFSSLTDRNVLAPQRRTKLPELGYAVSIPTHAADLNDSLVRLRTQAWKAVNALELEALGSNPDKRNTPLG